MTWNNRAFLLVPLILTLLSFNDTSPTLSELDYRKIDSGLIVSFKALTAIPLDLLVNVNSRNVVHTTSLGKKTYSFEVASAELGEGENFKMEFRLGDLKSDIFLANPTKEAFHEVREGQYLRVLSLDFEGKEVRETLTIDSLDFELWSDLKVPRVEIARISSNLTHEELSSYEFKLVTDETEDMVKVVEKDGVSYIVGEGLMTPSQKRLSSYALTMGNGLLKYEGKYLVRKAISATKVRGEYGIYSL